MINKNCILEEGNNYTCPECGFIDLDFANLTIAAFSITEEDVKEWSRVTLRNYHFENLMEILRGELGLTQARENIIGIRNAKILNSKPC